MARRRWFCFAALALLLMALLALAPPARATPSAEEHRLITALIERVENMKTMKFLRNGDEHSSTDAAEHMQAKYKHFKDEIKTAEDFIERCASRSEVTGKPYAVKLADGKVQDANAFLMRELRVLRRSAG